MIIQNFHLEIPTYDNGIWTTTVYDDAIAFREFVKSVFKEPGKYEFDETSLLFNEQARLYSKLGKVYCIESYRSKDYIKYWDKEKQRCINGIIFKNAGKTWYLPRDYYMWINFLPIYDKLKKKFDFPLVWDVQLHIALYELLAELHSRHAAIVKKRQIASSYFHCAKLINRIWFDEGVILKMGASLKDYINLSGSWKFLEEYRTFLNGHTAWYRPMNPGKVLEWQQKIEVTQNGRKRDKGLKGMIQGMSFEQSDTKGVGGPTTIFYYEEAGIAPTMDKTYEYIRPALNLGEFTTGLFVAAGSVGKLSDAEPLRLMVTDPIGNDIYPVETDLIDENHTKGLTGLFIPEQWGMPPYIDDYGNSQVDAALEALDKLYAQWKLELTPNKYQHRISQHPRNLKEAFAHRDESKFPVHLLEHQLREIEEGAYPYECVDLDESVTGEIIVRKSNKVPIDQFPISKKEIDKEGVIVVWERPDKDAPWGTYVASIDPVSEGKSVTSESLCSIYVYKMPTQVKRYTDNNVENFIEGDKVVAAWCGRFDDINNTHKRLRLIIEWYNAWTVIENNISLFILYMMKEHKQKYLVPKDKILFLKEMQANKTVFQDYGWKNTGTMFKAHLLNYLIEFVSEVVEEEIDDDGTIKKKFYGIRRIPDKMAIIEMFAYRDGVNVDRLVALCALIAFVKILLSNMERPVKVENEMNLNLENSEKLYKLDRGVFRNIGRNPVKNSFMKSRSPFKHRR